MAIIDRPKTESEAEEPSPVSGIISKPKAQLRAGNAADDRSYRHEPAPAKSGGAFFSWFKWLFLLLLLGGAAALAPKYLQQINFESGVKVENIALEVDRLIRIDSVIVLLEKKIEQNQSSLQRSEKLGDKVLVDTMRLALAQNLIDIEKHQDSFIDTLVSLNGAYQSDSGLVVSALKDQLKSSADSYKLGRVSTIKDVLDLMESVPEGKAPKAYFSEKIKKQK
jgi:hypothetical protein